MYAATATFFECLTGRPPFRGDTPEALLYQHLSQPVPVDAVPEPVRPLVAAGMAKQPEDRPADAITFVAALNQAAARAYGPGWRERGRTHLAEAALLLAALWPSGGPAAVQGSTVARTPLHRRNWRSRLRFTGAVKAGIAVITVAITAAGALLGVALTRSSSYAVTLPAVTGVSPGGGGTAGGTTVSITGTGLADATVVRFGTAAAVITADSATQITVTSPPGSGTVTITVTTRAGTSKTTAVGHYAYTTRPKRTQSISFTAPASGTAGGSATLSATGGGSGDPVVFSVDPSSGPGVCTVSGTTVTFTAAGSCVIDANQASAGSYAAAPQVQQTITVSAIPQPISATAQAPGTVPTPKAAPTAAAAPGSTAPAAAATPTAPAVTPAPTAPAVTPAPTAPAVTPAPTQTSSPPASFGWTATEAPLPAGAAGLGPGGGLGSVACPSASSCVATGGYSDSSGNKQSLLLTGSGTSWTAAEAPLPADADVGTDPEPEPDLNSVACPSASSCVVAGLYTDESSASLQGLLLTGSGTSWTATETPLPAGADPGAGLWSVACPSASSCVAVGSYTDSSGNGQGLLVSGTG